MKVGVKVLLAGLLVGLLVGCGSPAQPAGSLKVTMTEYAYVPSVINLTDGKAVFYLVNSGSQAHDLVIRDAKGIRLTGSDLVSPGDSSIFKINLPEGSYAIFCDQQGHEASGMIGTLTISAASPGEGTPTAGPSAAATSPPPSARASASPYSKTP